MAITKKHRTAAILLSIIMVITMFPLYSLAAEVPDGFTLVSDEETVLAPGIVQNKTVLYKPDGSRLETFAATADTSVSTVSIGVNYKDNQYNEFGMQVLSEQVAAAERKHAEPYSVVSAINASGYSLTTGKPTGIFVMDGYTRIGTGGSVFFAVLKDGTPVIANGSEFENYKADVQQAVAGTKMIVKDGEITAKITNTDVYPITSVGITADNKVVFMVADGRIESSAGATEYEQAQLMLELGCVDAIYLTGGGASVYGAKEPGKDFAICSTPSDGGERAIGTSLMMVSTAAPTGEFDHAYIDSGYSYLTCGTSLQLNPVGLDVNENDAALPQSGLAWSVSDASKGAVNENGVFTAADEADGKVTVYLNYNGARVGEKELNIVVPDTIKFSKKKINVPYDQDVLLPISGYIDGIPVAVNMNDFIAVHEYEYNGTVHESLLDNYGYFDGMYFHTPAEEIGIKTETLYLVPIFAEDESLLSSMKLEFFNEGDEYFDFDNATVKTDKLSWYREVTNTTTNDSINYNRIENADPVYINYSFGLAMDEMDLPEELEPMWNAFSGAMGSNIWEAFLRLANKIDPSTSVTIDLTLDENVEVEDFSTIRLVSDLFTLDPDEIIYDEETNTVKCIMRWNQDYVNETIAGEGMTPDTVSATVITDGISIKLKDDADLSSASGLNIVNNVKISYSFIALSDTAYGIAADNEALAPYAFTDGKKKGICFSTTYIDIGDSFTLFKADEIPEGWTDDSYYVDGQAVTGVNLVPAKDGEESYYYEFDDSGICTGKYTGIVKTDDKIVYADDGSASFAGLVQSEDGDFYYFDETLEAAGGDTVYIEKGNGLCDEGTYKLLEDKRIVLEENDELISIVDYDEAASDETIVFINNDTIITTGTELGFYQNGVLTVKTVVQYGDTDSDGWYNGQDAIVVNCIATGLLTREQVGEAAYAAADCNHDGTVDAEDVLILEQAGILLAQVDQTKPDYMESDAFVEYLNLIDQTPSPEAEEETPEEPADEEPVSPLMAFLAKVIDFIQKVIIFVRALFPKI